MHCFPIFHRVVFIQLRVYIPHAFISKWIYIKVVLKSKYFLLYCIQSNKVKNVPVVVLLIPSQNTETAAGTSSL